MRGGRARLDAVAVQNVRHLVDRQAGDVLPQGLGDHIGTVMLPLEVWRAREGAPAPFARVAPPWRRPRVLPLPVSNALPETAILAPHLGGREPGAFAHRLLGGVPRSAQNRIHGDRVLE